jgi:hypothetical protein
LVTISPHDLSLDLRGCTSSNRRVGKSCAVSKKKYSFALAAQFSRVSPLKLVEATGNLCRKTSNQKRLPPSRSRETLTMFCNDVYTGKYFFHFLIGLSLSALTVSPGTARETTDARCLAALPTHLGGLVRDVSPTPEARCHTFEVPAAGLLMLEVNATTAGIEPQLEVALGACFPTFAQRTSAAVALQFANRAVVATHEPARLLFCVSAQDHDRGLGGYKLRSVFVAAVTTKDDDPREEEDDPDPLVAGGVDSGFVFPELTRACRDSAEDDHGDSFSCATQLRPGTTSGWIGNDWGDDEDIFAFELDTLRTMHLTLDGAARLSGIHDHSGQRLALGNAADDAAGNLQRIVTRLAPGRYFVRVSENQGTQGPYLLRLEVAER